MSWQDLLAANRVRRHTTSRQELTDLRAATETETEALLRQVRQFASEMPSHQENQGDPP
jgi:hypothetical protein